MSSFVDLDTNVISTTNEAYRIILLYMVGNNGSHDGSFMEPSLKIWSLVQGDSYEEMVDKAYHSLEAMKEEFHNILVHIDDIYEVVIFNLFSCNTQEDWFILPKSRNAGWIPQGNTGNRRKA